MKKALSYFVNREFSRGWSGWQASWAERLAKLESLRRGMAFFLNRELCETLVGLV